jgi:subtilisin family serine protease
LRNTYAIAAANMSLGGGTYTSVCDSDSRKSIIDSLRNAGIATVISSGNDGYTNATGAPGCISSAITVGSSTKTDAESSFSNAASWVDLMAPGSSICSSVNGWTQNCGTGYGFASGTSMAAPHVTGTWAVMKSKNGVASVSAIESALESTGVPIATGAGNKPRIDLDNALARLPIGLNKGLNWDHCQQTYRGIGETVTWCYLETNNTWIALNDEEAEESLIESTAANHWVGIGVSSISGTSFTVSDVRVFRY